jgi:hypothetical protein
MTIKEMLEGAAIPTLRGLKDCLAEFLIDRVEACPAEIRDQAQKCLTAQLCDWDDLIHIVYANIDECGPIIKALAANVAVCFATFGFQGGLTKSKDEAGALSLILKREAGQIAPPGVQWPDKASDPPINAKFAKTDEAEAQAIADAAAADEPAP